MAIEIGEGTSFASHVLTPRLLLISHGWPREHLPVASSSYEVVFPSYLKFRRAAPHTTNPYVVAPGHVRLHGKGLRHIYAATTREMRYVPSATMMVVPTNWRAP